MQFDTKTKWTNPTDTDAKLVFFDRPGEFVRVTVPAKKSVEIESRFDLAIHQIRNGVIVGGLAPFLVREGQTETVHPALQTPDAKPKSPPQ